jgi:hypothetical protein
MMIGDSHLFGTNWDISNINNMLHYNYNNDEYSLIKNDVLLEKGIYNYSIITLADINNAAFITINARHGRSLKHGNTNSRKRLKTNAAAHDYN